MNNKFRKERQVLCIITRNTEFWPPGLEKAKLKLGMVSRGNSGSGL
jgi:hypothetical protein